MSDSVKCKNCGSERILAVSGKCSDLCSVQELNGTEETDGYVPHDLNIGGGDYLEFGVCLECGQLTGEFPVHSPFDQDCESCGEQKYGDQCRNPECPESEWQKK